jgi:hypothetical protein
MNLSSITFVNVFSKPDKTLSILDSYWQDCPNLRRNQALNEPSLQFHQPDPCHHPFAPLSSTCTCNCDLQESWVQHLVQFGVAEHCVRVPVEPQPEEGPSDRLVSLYDMGGGTEGNRKRDTEGDGGGGVERKAGEDPATGNSRFLEKEVCGSML